MKALATFFLVLGLIAAVAGCASNPFASSSASSESPASASGEVYYDLFGDIPIPRDMSVDRKRTLVSRTPNGPNIGLLTVSGRVELHSLNDAMIRNMARQGWTLRAATTGVKTMQIYEKASQYAVIYTYERTLYTDMEIWSAQRLNESPASPAGSGGVVPFQLDPVPLAPGPINAAQPAPIKAAPAQQAPAKAAQPATRSAPKKSSVQQTPLTR